MKNLRPTLLWISAGGLSLLSVASIGGAFVGAERAQAVFSSPPFIVLWCALALLLLAGVVLFKKVRRSPALLAMHVGPLLVLIGSMGGSRTAHRLWGRLMGGGKTDTAYLVLFEGESSNRLLDDSYRNKVGELPFRVRLSDFRIERYPPDDPRWGIVVTVPRLSVRTLVGWKEGAERKVPGTQLSLMVQDYLPHARAVYEAGPRLKLRTEQGQTRTIPAREGEKMEVADPAANVRIERVFRRLRVEGREGNLRPVEAESGPENPALQVSVRPADGQERAVFVMPGLPPLGRTLEDLHLSYVEPVLATVEEVGAPAPPAMKIRLRRGEKKIEQWLLPARGANNTALLLDDLYPGAEPRLARHRPILHMVRPKGQIKDYLSDLVVMEGEEPVARKTIEVNHPLHHGGYHLYQYDYDKERGRYSILLVKSDSGLWTVYAGFLLLAAGVFWGCWFGPLLSRFRTETTPTQ
jgi:hypothetical protein